MPSRLRLHDERGYMMIELLAGILILTIALLAVMAGYDTAFVSLHKADRQTTATKLANRQLERYSALPFAAIGLDATATNAAASDSLYSGNDLLAGDVVTDPITGVQTQLPSGTVNDVTIAGCGAAANCLPIQAVTALDGHAYRIESFVRDRPNSPGITWTERDVTVLVRDADAAGQPELVRLTTAFDRGP